MEQTDTGHGHGDPILVAGIDDVLVTDAAAGLGHVFHAAAMGPFDVVPKGEEGVGAPVSYTHLTLPTTPYV